MVLEISELLARYGNRRRKGAQPAVDREEDEFDPIVNAEFVVDVREVMFYGVFADAECRRDIFVGLTIDEGADNLNFPLRKTQPCDLDFGCAGGLNDGGRTSSIALPFRA